MILLELPLQMMREITTDNLYLSRAVAVPHAAEEESETTLEMTIAVVVDVREVAWETAVWTRARTSQFQAQNLCLRVDNSVAEKDDEEKRLCQ
jgi:mannitol/fructose-specific phosphotransferase system IIA component